MSEPQVAITKWEDLADSVARGIGPTIERLAAQIVALEARVAELEDDNRRREEAAYE